MKLEEHFILELLVLKGGFSKNFAGFNWVFRELEYKFF